MAAQQAASEGLMARTVRETLGTVASAGVVQRILDAALYHAEMSTVPEDVDKARRFVEGPLRASIHAALGEETAEAVRRDLHPILEMASSHVRAKDPPPPSPQDAPVPQHAVVGGSARDGRTTDSAPERRRPRTVNARESHRPTPVSNSSKPPIARIGLQRSAVADRADAPLVLIATLDRSGIQRVARRLVGRATVRAVQDVFELVYALEANVKRRPLVVLDCCLPAVEPQLVGSMLGGLNDAPRVVLWGGTESLRETLEGTLPAARDWIPLSADATDEDVATLLESLL